MINLVALLSCLFTKVNIDVYIITHKIELSIVTLSEEPMQDYQMIFSRFVGHNHGYVHFELNHYSEAI